MTDRKFEGKIFKEYTFCPKANLEFYKRSLKEAGYLVRTVKQKNGYIIYTRKA